MICNVNGCEKDTEFAVDFWCKEHAKIYRVKKVKCPNCLKKNTMTTKSWYMKFNRCLDCKYEWEKKDGV